MADIALTHGGAGTVQTAIHAGTPLVGVPMQLEQAGNISLVQRQCGGILLSRLELTRKKLGAALERLTTERGFRDNMLRLKSLQDSTDGPSVAARELLGFLDERA
jgi:UDP:flavonoid glycosyltransferase YjiC (YdhE family)